MSSKSSMMPPQMCDLAFDDITRPRAGLFADTLPHERDRRQHRRYRLSEFVRHGCDEDVLSTVGVSQGLLSTFEVRVGALQRFLPSIGLSEIIHRLIGGRSKSGQTFEAPEVFSVEPASFVMGNRPDGADGLALNIERNEETFLDSRGYR